LFSVLLTVSNIIERTFRIVQL